MKNNARVFPAPQESQDVLKIRSLFRSVGAMGASSFTSSVATAVLPLPPDLGKLPGGDGQINGNNYLAGGVPFGGPFISRNLTPDASGKPAGLTFEQFLHVLRTGEDPEEPGELLQVMPWPVFRNMTDRDIQAIYEYLSAIPHADQEIVSFLGGNFDRFESM